MAEKIITMTGHNEVLRGLKELDKFMKSEKPMTLLTEDVKGRIIELTDRSVDYRGRRFAPYSKRYAKFKRKKTGSAKVNLRLSGQMMNSITTKVLNSKHGRVFVMATGYGRITAEWLAQIHSQGTGNQKQREFMNITNNALKVFIKKRYDDPILNIVRHYFRKSVGTGA